MSRRPATPQRDVLAQAYVDMIGYDPFEDCPDISPETVSQTLQEFALELTQPATERKPITSLCPNCSARAAADRVTLHKKSWAGSPMTWLGGPISDLQALAAAGMAELQPDGWYVPTIRFPA